MGAALCLFLCVVRVCVSVVLCVRCDSFRDRIHGLPFIHRTRWGRPCVCVRVWCVSVSLLCCVVFCFEILFTAFLSFTGRDGGGPVSVSVCGACLCCVVLCCDLFRDLIHGLPFIHRT